MKSLQKNFSCLLNYVGLNLFLYLVSAFPVLAEGGLIVTMHSSNSWMNGNMTCFQYEVTVQNNSSSARNGWSFVLPLEGGSYDQSWCCAAEETEGGIFVKNLDWNGYLAAGTGSASGIGIVLSSPSGDIYSGTYEADDSTGVLVRTGGPEPTQTPALTGTPVPTPEPGPSPAPDGPHEYPSGAGMYGSLMLHGVDLYNEAGVPVQLRGVSTHGLAWYPGFVNEDTFRYLRDSWGANLIRLAMYTEEYGGYCSGGDRNGLENLIDQGVRACTGLGMYFIIDWHILADNDPNIHKAEALDFFDRMSKKYSGYNNVLYEICNEPHGTDWTSIRDYANDVIPVIRANAPDAIIIVGTNTWSQDVLDPAGSPVEHPYNVMYALHFYAASHGGWLRNRLVSARNSGVPVFISEFSTCDASGNGAIDYGEADEWKELIMEENLSYAGWNLANKDESSSIVKGSCSRLFDWTEDEISDTGKWLRELMLECLGNEPDYPEPDEKLDTLVLPQMLTQIEDESFQGSNAQCVVIPEKVEYIGHRAFAYSPRLKKVILRSSAAIIEPDAFEGCQVIVFTNPEQQSIP